LLTAAGITTRIDLPGQAPRSADPAVRRRELTVHDLPMFVWLLVLVGVIGIPALAGAALRRGALAAGLGPRTATAVAAAAGVVWAAWIAAVGIVDLVVAVSLGFLAGLGPAQVLRTAPSSEAVALLPLVLIPTTAVPLALALHIVSLHRLAVGARARGVSRGAVPAPG